MLAFIMKLMLRPYRSFPWGHIPRTRPRASQRRFFAALAQAVRYFSGSLFSATPLIVMQAI